MILAMLARIIEEERVPSKGNIMVSFYRIHTYAIGICIVLLIQVNENVYAEPRIDRGIATIIDSEEKGNAVYPDVVIDGSGNGTAAWIQYDGARNNIWSCRFTKGVGWGFPEMIERIDKDADEVCIGVDGGGVVTALWRQIEGTVYDLWSNRYVPGVGWGSPEPVESNTQTLFVPSVTVSKSGVAVASWCQFEGTGYRIWSNTYIPGKGWGNEKPIENGLTADYIKCQVGVDVQGNAIAVWYKSDGTRNNVWYNIFGIDSGWGDPALLEDNDIGDSSGTEIVFDEDGNALAAWMEDNGVVIDIWCRWYRPENGWGDPEKLDVEDKGGAVRPDIGFDSSGNAFVVWEQFDGVRNNIWGRRYIPGTGWEGPELIEKDDTGEARQASIAVAPEGDAIVAWRQYDGTRFNIWSNGYVKGSGWDGAELIETDNFDDAERPSIACDRSGNTLVLWHQDNGEYSNIWAYLYARPDTTPPELVITSPVGLFETYVPTVKIMGRTEPGAVLSINGLMAEVADNGSFSMDIALFPGSNIVKITSRDDSGNSESDSITVSYIDPFPGLNENITGLIELLESLSDRVDLNEAGIESLGSMISLLEEGSNLTGDDIESLMENITWIRISLNVSGDDNNTLLDMLSLISERLNATMGEIGSISSEQDSFDEDLTELKEQQDRLREDMDSIGPVEDDEDEGGMTTLVYALFVINLGLFLLLGLMVVALFSYVRRRGKRDDGME